MTPNRSQIGFVSTRLAGTDGVSLEVIKWVAILEALGHTCYFFAGELDWPAERSYQVEEAHFQHPEILHLTRDLFDDFIRSAETSQTVERLKNQLKNHLYEFVRRFDLDLLIVENALAIPMNIPLGLALTELIAETNLPVIAHHHDFTWERARFVTSAADDYLRAAFPPTLNSVHHVVINSFAARQVALRTGMNSMLIPNVIDFETAPEPLDEYARGLRPALGLKSGQRLLLQPTRIVPRKRIEQAINLTHWLNSEAALVISHSSGDEGAEYEAYLSEYAEALNVTLIFAAGLIDHVRGTTADGRPIYSLADAYQQADIVTYPSIVEGFGNAFLEAIYFKRPIVMSAYEIFKIDIQPKGFKVVSFEEFITSQTIEQTQRLLHDPAYVAEMVEHNYELGRRHYSYKTLEEHLVALLGECLGTW